MGLSRLSHQRRNVIDIDKQFSLHCHTFVYRYVQWTIIMVMICWRSLNFEYYDLVKSSVMKLFLYFALGFCLVGLLVAQEEFAGKFSYTISHNICPWHFCTFFVVVIFPADTSRNNDFAITSKRRHFGVFTSKWRCFDVITTLLLRHVFSGLSFLS